MAGQAPPELVALVATDPEIQSRVRRLILASLDEAAWQLQHGNATTKASIMRHAVPALLSAMKQDNANTEIDEMKKAYAELRAEFQTYVTPALTTPSPQTAEDAPIIPELMPADRRRVI